MNKKSRFSCDSLKRDKILACDANLLEIIMNELSELLIERKRSLQESFLKHIGSVIASKRKLKNLSQGELGDFLDVSVSTISRYENGAMEIPVSSLPLICEKCDFHIREYLVGFESESLKQLIRKCLEASVVVYSRRTDYNVVKEKTSEYGSDLKIVKKSPYASFEIGDRIAAEIIDACDVETVFYLRQLTAILEAESDKDELYDRDKFCKVSLLYGMLLSVPGIEDESTRNEIKNKVYEELKNMM